VSVDIDPTKWTPLTPSLNSKNYEVEPGIYAAVPDSGARDTGETARDNIAKQREHLAPRGGGVVVIFFDNLISQDKDARRVYQAESDPSWMHGTALVGGTMLSRAIGSFFLGLSKPRTPLKMFGSFDDALAWAREQNRTAAAKEPAR
jgi:hypothetical protein